MYQKIVSWVVRCSSVAPVIGSWDERVVLACSRPNRRWTSALEVVVNGGGQCRAPKLQHLGGGHHVAEDWTLPYELVGDGELVRDNGMARMDGHGV